MQLKLGAVLFLTSAVSLLAEERFFLRNKYTSVDNGPYMLTNGQFVINNKFQLASVQSNSFEVHWYVGKAKYKWGPFVFKDGTKISVSDTPFEIISGERFSTLQSAKAQRLEVERAQEVYRLETERAQKAERLEKERAYEAECKAKGMEKFEGQWATKEQIAVIKAQRLETLIKKQAEQAKFAIEQADALKKERELAKLSEEYETEEYAERKAIRCVQGWIDSGRLISATCLGTERSLYSFAGVDKNMFTKTNPCQV